MFCMSLSLSVLLLKFYIKCSAGSKLFVSLFMCFNHVLKVNIGLCFSIYSTDCWFRCNNSSVLSWEGGWMQIHFGSSSFRSKFICSFVLRFSFCYFNLFSTSPLILFLPPTSLSLSPHIPQLSLSLPSPLSPPQFWIPYKPLWATPEWTNAIMSVSQFKIPLISKLMP